MLRKTTVAILVSSMFAAPVYAQSGFDGFVSGAVGPSKLKFSAFSEEAPSSTETDSELRASFAFTSSYGLGFQLDQVYSRIDYGDLVGSGQSLEVNSTDTAGHLFYRFSPGNLIGVFVQQRVYDFRASDPSADILLNAVFGNRRFFGVEGQVFFGDLEVSGQVGSQKQEFRYFSDASGDLDGNLVFVSANYFLSEDWKIGLRFGQTDLDYGSVESGLGKQKVKSYALQTEYRFQGSPIGIFAHYSRFDTDFPFGNLSAQEDRFMVGLKVHFGSGSLRSQAESGASLNPVSEPRLSVFSAAL